MGQTIVTKSENNAAPQIGMNLPLGVADTKRGCWDKGNLRFGFDYQTQIQIFYQTECMIPSYFEQDKDYPIYA